MYTNGQIRLEFFTKEFLYDFHHKSNYKEWFIDPIVNEYNSHGLYYFQQAQIQSFLDEISKNRTSMIVFAIIYITTVHRSDGYKEEIEYHIGNCSLQNIDYINDSCEIAWLIGEKEYWGKGIATQAGQFLLEHAFLKLGMNRVYGGTSEHNKGMKNVFWKLGFKEEGFQKEAHFYNGSYTNVINYALLKQEWIDK